MEQGYRLDSGKELTQKIALVGRMDSVSLEAEAHQKRVYTQNLLHFGEHGEPLGRVRAAGVPLAAEPSPDGVHLAVLCAAQGKSVVHIFSLDSEDELSSCSFSDELFFGIGWLNDSKLCVLSENRVCAVSVNGKKRGEFDFGGLSLAEYEIYDGGIGLYLRGFESGGEQRLVSLDSDLRKTDRDQ